MWSRSACLGSSSYSGPWSWPRTIQDHPEQKDNVGLPAQSAKPGRRPRHHLCVRAAAHPPYLAVPSAQPLKCLGCPFLPCLLLSLRPRRLPATGTELAPLLFFSAPQSRLNDLRRPQSVPTACLYKCPGFLSRRSSRARPAPPSLSGSASETVLHVRGLSPTGTRPWPPPAPCAAPQNPGPDGAGASGSAPAPPSSPATRGHVQPGGQPHPGGPRARGTR